MIKIEKIIIQNNPQIKHNKPYLTTIDDIKLMEERYFNEVYGIIYLSDNSIYSFNYIGKGWEFIQLDYNEKKTDSFTNLGSLVHSFDKFLVRKNSLNK